MEASFFSKLLSQSEYRIKITSQLLSESECRNLGRDLTQKTQTNKMAEARHNADKHYLLTSGLSGAVGQLLAVMQDKIHQLVTTLFQNEK